MSKRRRRQSLRYEEEMDINLLIVLAVACIAVWARTSRAAVRLRGCRCRHADRRFELRGHRIQGSH
jgi:hypothetical protein